MASLPSAAVTGTLKIDPDFRKLPTPSLAAEKSASVWYQRSQINTQLSGVSESIRPLDFREALSIIKEGTKADTSHYLSLLQECIRKNSVPEAQVIHGHIIKSGTHEDNFLMTFLVNVYAKCGKMEDAHKVFDSLAVRNVFAWTNLISGYVQNVQPEVAIQVFQEMMETGSYPSNYTLGAALTACALLSCIELGKQFHAFIIKYQIDHDTSVGNSLCSLYSKIGSLESAVKVFQKIREKNVVSWTAVISACGENGDAARGLRFFTQMLSQDIEPNGYTLTSVLSMCCVMLSLGVGMEVHSLSIKLGYQSNLRITNSIMYLYLKCGCIKEAQTLFDKVESISLITWNAMIAGYAQSVDISKYDFSVHHSGIEGLKNFVKLNRSGMKPDLFTFSSILTVCSRLVALEQGEQIHAQTIKTGFLSDAVVGTALVNMYNKCGATEKASKAFLEMSKRTLISWTSMITGFAQNGQYLLALQLFDDMRLAGVRPNQVTFVGVLAACIRGGMVNEALNYFESMQKDSKIKPVMDHYACLTEVFVKLGRLDEALDLIKKMNFEPNEVIWSSLIAGCITHGNLELGLYAAEQLLKLKPRDPETYLSLLNIYTSAERWEDVSTVRKMMKEEMVGKLKDWSWICIKENIFSFKPSDRTNPQTAEMYELLEELLDKAKNFGYESSESLEAIDEEDEEMTFALTVYQSEKLAVSFGLLNIPNVVPIRVIKSTSMSRDSHNFIKAISLITDREIIIRDCKQIHKFVNGYCSCGKFVHL